MQGSVTDPVGNRFVNMSIPEYSLWKATSAAPVDYYHHSTIPYIPPASIQYFVPHNTGIAGDESTCPSHFDTGGGGQGQKSAFFSSADAKEEIEIFEQSVNDLFAIIDGGSTAQLIAQANDPGVSSFQLKNDLIEAGPYLSDSVLNASLSRTNPLTNNDAKVVVLNNSPVTDTVYTVLEEEKPAVAGNVVVAFAQEGVSDRTNLEAAMGSLNLQRHYALRELRDYYDENDSLQSGYHYFSEKNMNLLALSYGFVLNDWQATQQIIDAFAGGDFKTYAQWVLDKYAAGKSMDSLTADDMELMATLANEQTYSGILASNQIAFHTHTWYNEEIPVAQSSEQKQMAKKTEQTIDLPRLYPNPADATFFYLIPEGYEGEYVLLVVYDVFGKEKIKMAITTNSIEIPVDIRSLSQGIYYCTLLEAGEVISKEKLVVLR